MVDVTLNATVDSNQLAVTLSTIQSVNFVGEGTKFYLNGNNGNTYLIANSSTKNVELWVQGTKVAEWSHD